MICMLSLSCQVSKKPYIFTQKKRSLGTDLYFLLVWITMYEHTIIINIMQWVNYSWLWKIIIIFIC